MAGSRIFLASFALVATSLAGCIADLGAEDVDPASLTQAAFDTSRGWSMPLAPPVYDMLEGVKETVESFDGTPISLGIFRPDIPGCDWDASELPAECRLPVVMDSGPYYGNHVDQDKYRPPLIEWLVPRGYAVVQMSVRGTGESGACMEFMSMNEQKDVDAMVTWLGEAPWSNGNVGMMGRSYDGTTPFMAAALGNPHLKTIVPISGVASVPDLMFKNGTSELRGPIMHSVVYWGLYGVQGPGYRTNYWSEQACEEFVMGATLGPMATATGDTSDTYWVDRDFRPRIVENYKGSVWVVHGLEDWNVNPSQVVPWLAELREAGIETKAWLGVWGHAYPDRMDEHRNVRWDWAQQTVEWFDFYLKGEGTQPALVVEVEDSLFVWRAEETYPPKDIVWRDIDASFGAPAVAASMPVSFQTEPLEDALRIAGLPRLHVEVTPATAAGGYLFAELYDIFPDGRAVRIGWGAIDLRYHAGGNDEPATLVPGMPVTAMMEFEPADAHVGEGHSLRLVVHRDGVEDILASPDPSPLGLGAATLRLPTVDRPSILPSYTAPGLGFASAGAEGPFGPLGSLVDLR